MEANIQRRLYEVLVPINAQLAALTAEDMVNIIEYQTLFLKRYRIYRVYNFAYHHPILFYVGFALNEPVYLLTTDSQVYIDLARADGVELTTPETAINYARVFLEVTRHSSVVRYVVNNVDEVEFLPHFNDDDKAAQEAFLRHYRSIVVPPAATPLAPEDGFCVTIYLINQQSLERHTLIIKRDGHLVDEVVKLEPPLPLI